MDSKTLLALIDSLVNDAVSNIKIIEGPQGPRGLKGKDGNDFNIDEHKSNLFQFVKNSLLEIELPDEILLKLKGDKGEAGESFDFESCRVYISEIISNYISDLAPSLKLKFSDLTENEIDKLRGPRGQRGRPGKDFSLDEVKPFIKESVADSVMALTPDLKLKFEDLSDDDIESLKGPKGDKGDKGKDLVLDDVKPFIEEFIADSVMALAPDLKLKFEDLSDDDIESLKGPKGDKGDKGKDLVLDDVKPFIESEISETFESLKPDLKLTFNDLSEEEKESLKLKFTELTDEEVDRLRGPRGQRGKQGQPGINGLDGATWFTGKGYPQISGNINDLYLDIETGGVYLYSDGWQLKTNITGPTGSVGPRGMIGPNGLNGRNGRDGIDGQDGQDAPIITDIRTIQEGNEVYLIFEFDNGFEIRTNSFELPNPQNIYNVYSVRSGGEGGSGQPGEDGKSAYEIAVENGFVGTEEEWLESLIGAKGDKGDQGEQGPQGEPGEPGEPFPSDIFIDTGEPTGFVNRVDSQISFSGNTFTIAPIASEYAIYIQGQKILIDESKSITLPNESGNYYLYLDENSVLNITTVFSLELLKRYAYVSYIYWDAEDQVAVTVGDERHGITMDGDTHLNLHTTRGTQIVSGGEIAYILGNGSLATHSQISLANMRIADEDIVVDIVNSSSPNNNFEQRLNPVAYIPVWYREGIDLWKKSVATNFPILIGPNRAYFNELVGNTWQLTEAPSNNKVIVSYVFATTSIYEPVISILGQNQYQNIAEAREIAGWRSVDFGTLPSPEMKLLYMLFYETSSNYNNPSKSRLAYVEDLRFAYDKPIVAAAQNNNHSTLLNLDADDHPQYLTEARGDDRYYTQQEIDDIVADLTLGVGVQVISNTTNEISSSANTFNFSNSFELTTNTVMSDWQLLSEVLPSIAEYNSPTASQVNIGFPDKNVIKNLSCSTDVEIGDFVVINSSGTVVKAIADKKSTSKVLGLVENKPNISVCEVRTYGKSIFAFSGLLVDEDYWLSDSLAGVKTTIKPTTTDHYAISLGQAISETEFLVDIGTRFKI